MKLLLDTHVWVWAEDASTDLGKQTRRMLLDDANQLFVSTISSLELAQLLFKGRIVFRRPLLSWIDASFEALQLNTANLDHSVAIGSYCLPGDLHGDPADRVLVATALRLGATLVTADQNLLKYEHVQTFNARK